MTTTYIKSASITNLDATPPLFPTAGIGGETDVSEQDDYVSIASTVSTSDVFQVLRVPTHVVMKSLMLYSTAFAGTALDVNVGLSYSDNGPYDGSNASNNAGVVNASLFAAGYVIGTAAMPAPVEVLYGGAVATAGSFILGNEQQPLWAAAGLSSDPGGFFDITVTPSTVTGTVTAGKLQLRALFSDEI